MPITSIPSSPNQWLGFSEASLWGKAGGMQNESLGKQPTLSEHTLGLLAKKPIREPSLAYAAG